MNDEERDIDALIEREQVVPGSVSGASVGCAADGQPTDKDLQETDTPRVESTQEPQSSGVVPAPSETVLTLSRYEAIKLEEILEFELRVVNKSRSDHELMNSIYRQLSGKDHRLMARYRTDNTVPEPGCEGSDRRLERLR